MGNTHGDADAIRSYFAGTSEAEVQAGLEALKSSGRFSNVSVTRRGDHVIVHVSEGNLINRVAFEGNSKVKTETLQTEMRTKAHGSFNPAGHRTRRGADWSRSTGARGAPRPRLHTAPSLFPTARSTSSSTIEEGDKTGVKEIKFIGNEVYSTSRLVGLMETTEMNFLSFLKTSDVYDPDRVAADLELVRRFYLKNGYADFHVISSEARLRARARSAISSK